MLYKILGWIFVIVVVAMVAYKETTVVDKTDIKYLFGKVSQQLETQCKVPKKNIYLSTEFKKHLEMNDYDQDTLGIVMKKDLGVEFGYEEFRKNKTVAEAIDFLRTKVKDKQAKNKLADIDQNTRKALSGQD